MEIFLSYDHKCTATFLWFTVYYQLISIFRLVHSVSLLNWIYIYRWTKIQKCFNGITAMQTDAEQTMISIIPQTAFQPKLLPTLCWWGLHSVSADCLRESSAQSTKTCKIT